MCCPKFWEVSATVTGWTPGCGVQMGPLQVLVMSSLKMEGGMEAEWDPVQALECRLPLIEGREACLSGERMARPTLASGRTRACVPIGIWV